MEGRFRVRGTAVIRHFASSLKKLLAPVEPITGHGHDDTEAALSLGRKGFGHDHGVVEAGSQAPDLRRCGADGTVVDPPRATPFGPPTSPPAPWRLGP